MATAKALTIAAATALSEMELNQAVAEAQGKPAVALSKTELNQAAAVVARPSKRLAVTSVSTEVTVARRQYYSKVSRDLYKGGPVSLPKVAAKPKRKKARPVSRRKKAYASRLGSSQQEEREDRTATRGANSGGRRAGSGKDPADRD